MFVEQKVKSTNIISKLCKLKISQVISLNYRKLILLLKLIYVQIYSDDNYLLLFHENIIKNIKFYLGEIFDKDNKIITLEDRVIEFPTLKEALKGRIKAQDIKDSEYPV